MTSAVLVDSNILLDLFTRDLAWFDWSASALAQAADHSRLVINPIIYAEISPRFSTIEDLETVLSPVFIEREQLSHEAAFLAGQAYTLYRRRKGPKQAPLGDFFIGAHAAVAGYSILTRDVSRYRSYFPTVRLIAPD